MLKRTILRGKSDTKYYSDKASFEVSNYNLNILKRDIECEFNVKKSDPKANRKDQRKKLAVRQINFDLYKNEHNLESCN